MLMENLPPTISPEIVGIARNILLENRAKTDLEDLEARVNLNVRITLTHALAEYRLNRDDISELQYKNLITKTLPPCACTL